MKCLKINTVECVFRRMCAQITISPNCVKSDYQEERGQNHGNVQLYVSLWLITGNLICGMVTFERSYLIIFLTKIATNKTISIFSSFVDG